jgi:hypothetical protein
VSRRTPLLVRTSLAAVALLAAGLFLRGDDTSTPPAPKPPPGYKVLYHDVGGKKVPIFVKQQLDPLRHAGGIGFDPLDPQKVFSESNPESNKTFIPAAASGVDKSADLNTQEAFATKVYDTTGPGSVYNLGSKSTYQTASYNGTKAAAGYDQSFATKSVSPELDQAASAFAPIGASGQNLTAPVGAKTYDTFASPEEDKKFTGPEEEASHNHLKRLSNGQILIEDIPDRPLSIDEVRDLINHGFKPDFTKPAVPDDKALNDPDYQPEPLRIDPPEDATPVPPAGTHKVQDDDANDPVPSPGTMAEHPENTEPLPSK